MLCKRLWFTTALTCLVLFAGPADAHWWAGIGEAIAHKFAPRKPRDGEVYWYALGFLSRFMPGRRRAVWLRTEVRH